MLRREPVSQQPAGNTSCAQFRVFLGKRPPRTSSHRLIPIDLNHSIFKFISFPFNFYMIEPIAHILRLSRAAVRGQSDNRMERMIQYAKFKLYR